MAYNICNVMKWSGSSNEGLDYLAQTVFYYIVGVPLILLEWLYSNDQADWVGMKYLM
jgi:hypothetical protein